jgi:succinoglycan biosynthesis protein ExoM
VSQHIKEKVSSETIGVFFVTLISNNRLIKNTLKDMELISICIATYKRKEYLNVLITSIFNQKNIDEYKIDIIVTDNDPNKSALEVVEKLSVGIPDIFSIQYFTQFEKSIPKTRNVCVQNCNRTSKFIIFVDDDEFADEYWIINLLNTQKEYNADLVCGPVYPKFVEKPKKWIVEGEFFIRSYYKEIKSGEERSKSGTGNLLVKSKLLFDLEKPFNEAMALTGGSDVELTSRLHLKGAKIIWTFEAVVYEWIPKERANFKYIKQRAFRLGNEMWRLSNDKSLLKRLSLIVHGFLRVFIGTIFVLPTLLISVFFGWHFLIKSIRLIVRGAGFASGAMNYNYQEYKQRCQLCQSN